MNAAADAQALLDALEGLQVPPLPPQPRFPQTG